MTMNSNSSCSGRPSSPTDSGFWAERSWSSPRYEVYVTARRVTTAASGSADVRAVLADSRWRRVERGQDLLPGRFHVVDPPAVVDRRVDDLVLRAGHLPAAGASVGVLAFAGHDALLSQGCGRAREHRPRGAATTALAARPPPPGRPWPARPGGVAHARRRRSWRCPAARPWRSTGRARPARSARWPSTRRAPARSRPRSSG